MMVRWGTVHNIKVVWLCHCTEQILVAYLCFQNCFQSGGKAVRKVLPLQAQGAELQPQSSREMKVSTDSQTWWLVHTTLAQSETGASLGQTASQLSLRGEL